MRKCIICGNEFEKQGNRQILCNNIECHMKRMRQLKKKYRDKNAIIYHKICKICGREFESNNPQFMTCSKECRKISKKNDFQKYYAKNKNELLERKKQKRLLLKVKLNGSSKICIICGKEFISYNSRTVACSDECKHIRQLQKINESNLRRKSLMIEK